MAGADKFGNIYFVRLPQDVSDEIEEDPTGGRIKWEQGKLNGAPNKVEEIVQFHVGDVVTCLQKASLIPGGGECIVFGTVMGSVGALHAFTSRDDVDFFSHLEMHMRQDHPPLCGRDHMAYRSAYFPVKVCLICSFCFLCFFGRGIKFFQISDSPALLCRMLLMGIYASNSQHCQWICREKSLMNWTEPLERY